MRGLAEFVCTGGLVLVLGLGLAAPALADEPGESDEAKVLVQQAIALIVNTPDDHAAIEERIEDAVNAPHQEGVRTSLVGRAADAATSGDLNRARTQLERSIGAGPYVGQGAPEPIRETTGEPGRPAAAVGAEAGTTVVLDAYDPGRRLDGGEIVLLILSAVAVAAGGLLAWRYRPADTVRQLERSAVPRQER